MLKNTNPRPLAQVPNMFSKKVVLKILKCLELAVPCEHNRPRLGPAILGVAACVFFHVYGAGSGVCSAKLSEDILGFCVSPVGRVALPVGLVEIG